MSTNVLAGHFIAVRPGIWLSGNWSSDARITNQLQEVENDSLDPAQLQLMNSLDKGKIFSSLLPSDYRNPWSIVAWCRSFKCGAGAHGSLAKKRITVAALARPCCPGYCIGRERVAQSCLGNYYLIRFISILRLEIYLHKLPTNAGQPMECVISSPLKPLNRQHTIDKIILRFIIWRRFQ